MSCSKLTAVVVVMIAIFIALIVPLGMEMSSLYDHESYLQWIMGQVATDTTAAHADKSRSAVGWTAILVALARAVETARSDSLFTDHIAERLFAVTNFDSGIQLSARLASAALISLPILQKIPEVERILSLVSIRSNFIDMQVMESLQLESVAGQQQQFVIIGAGLDSRAFRMSELFLSNNATLFEVDFAGMFLEKRRLFSNSGFDYNTLPFPVKQVAADISQPGWQRALFDAGFDQQAHTVWLAEGVTGYLLEQELNTLLTTLAVLSSPGSRVIATWIGFQSNIKLSMHRFFTEDPGKVIDKFGFSIKVQETTTTEWATTIGRASSQNNSNLLLTCHEKPKS